jgi:hypothetical protein
MKNIFLFSFSIFVAGCFGVSSSSFEKDFYEKTTKINFPKDYEIIASIDNGEFLTITILDLSKADCKKFIKDNKFEKLYKDTTTILKSISPSLNGLYLLDSAYRKLPDRNLLVRDEQFENGTGWNYYIDTLTCRLYCQINYPDKEG